METLIALALIGLWYFFLSGQHRKLFHRLVSTPQKEPKRYTKRYNHIGHVSEDFYNQHSIVASSPQDSECQPPDSECQQLRQTVLSRGLSEKEAEVFFTEASENFPHCSDRERWTIVLYCAEKPGQPSPASFLSQVKSQRRAPQRSLAQSLKDPRCQNLRQTAINLMLSEKKVDRLFVETSELFPHCSDRELWQMVLNRDSQQRNGRWWS